MERGVRFVFGAMIALVLFGTNAVAQPTVVTVVPDEATNFTEFGGLVYFTVGSALWRTDGTSGGTIQLRDGLSQPEVISWHERYAREFKGEFYFLDGYESELWKSDGTPSGTILLTTVTGNIRMLGATDDYIFFSAFDPSVTGTELYRTDGSVSGTTIVKDIWPGDRSGYDDEGAATIVGNELFFAGDDGIHGREPWKSDGTPEGTVMVKDVNPGSADGYGWSENAFGYNGLFFFRGQTASTGVEPWVSDGTEAGTLMLVDAAPGIKSSELITYHIENNDYVYFTSRDEDNFQFGELWKTGGTTATTSLVKPIEFDESSELHSFLVYHDKVYFWLRLGHVEDYLWVTDGTTAGSYSFFNIITVDGSISFFEVVNDYLLFTGSAESIPYHFYRSDGTNEGTRVFAKFKAQAPLVFPRDVTKVGDRVFYGDHDGLTQYMVGDPYASQDYYHLFEGDGNSASSMRTLWAVNTVETSNITGLNGKVVFTALHDGQRKLWIYDPALRPEPEPTFTLVHAGSDDDLRRLLDDALVVNPHGDQLNIRFNPVETPGSVVFNVNGSNVRTETAPPYSLGGDSNGDYAAWNGGTQPGTYTLKATPYSEAGGQGTPGESLTITFRIQDNEPDPENCTASGTILYEYWDDVSGTTVPAIPVGTPPTSTQQLTLFQGPESTDTNFGARIRGYICPPASGAYTFWIASNDHSELWLSTDDNPANKRRIANLTRATAPLEWDKFASQKSMAIELVAGESYYIEALHKQGVGSQHVAVGWQLPDGTMERPIQGNRLSPADPTKNTAPVISIVDPDSTHIFAAPANVPITVNVSDPDGSITMVEYFEGSTKIGENRNDPYWFTWPDVGPGTYTLTAKATDNGGASTTSKPVTFLVQTYECMASGSIMREYWKNVQGARVSDIPVNTRPTGTQELTSLATPSDMGINYATRIRGYICPPSTGDYVFYISSNDHSELWLSTDDDPANKQRVAYVAGATAPNQWDKFPSQMSSSVHLIAGYPYYVEALHKQGIGSDHFAVAWRLPNGVFEGPITGSHLSRFFPNTAAAARVADSESKSFQEISIYPNPATVDDRELTIGGYEGVDQMFDTHIRILNMTGNVVHSEKVRCGGDCGSYLMKIDQQLVPGLYIVDMEANGVRHSKRLLVK